MMKACGLKRKLENVNFHLADLDRSIAEISEQGSDLNALDKAALEAYKDIKNKYLVEKANLASRIGRKD